MAGKPQKPAGEAITAGEQRFLPAPRNPGGRPASLVLDDPTLQTIEHLGMIWASTVECAAWLNVTEPTFINFKKKHPEAEAAYKRGWELGKSSLRRTQLRLAQKNAVMAIFLGMQHLGQKDLRQQWAHQSDRDAGTGEDKRVVIIKGGLPDDPPGGGSSPPTIDAVALPPATGGADGAGTNAGSTLNQDGAPGASVERRENADADQREEPL